MAVAIRLKRMGRKKQPFYRVIVTDTKKPRQGEAVDDLGFYNPIKEPAYTEINEEKALKWLNEGAIPSNTVRSIFSKAGIIRKFHGIEEPEEEVTQDTETEEAPEEKPQENEQADDSESESEESE